MEDLKKKKKDCSYPQAELGSLMDTYSTHFKKD